MLQITCGRRRAARRASDDGSQINEIRKVASCSCFSRWPFPIFNLFPGLLVLPFRQMQKQIGLMPCHSSVLTFLLLPIWATLQKWRKKKKNNTVVKTNDAEIVVHETNILWPTIVFQLFPSLLKVKHQEGRRMSCYVISFVIWTVSSTFIQSRVGDCHSGLTFSRLCTCNNDGIIQRRFYGSAFESRASNRSAVNLHSQTGREMNTGENPGSCSPLSISLESSPIRNYPISSMDWYLECLWFHHELQSHFRDITRLDGDRADWA